MIQTFGSRLRRWQTDQNKWRLYILIAVTLYFIAINQVIHVRPDHIFLALIILSLALGKDRARRFLIDWSPFVFFWTAYDMMRGVADSVRGVIHITQPYRWEKIMFSPLLHGEIPSFYLQAARETWPVLVKGLADLLAANFYTLHFGMPLLVGWIFWHTTDDRPLFYQFVYTLTVLNFLALITFMVFPAAPPWYVYNYGFLQPEPNSSFWGTSAGTLIDVDRLLGVKFFATLWDSFNANHFAAIPSLHGAYPVVISWFLYKKFRRKGFWLSLYPAGTWFSAVYLNQHYVVDLLIAVLYIVIAYLMVKRILYPRIFQNRVEASAGDTKPEPQSLHKQKIELYQI